MLTVILLQVWVLFCSASDEWFEMPNGMHYHSDCIHQYEEEFHVRDLPDGRSHISFKDGQREDIIVPRCPHTAKLSQALGSSESINDTDGVSDVRYYSDWVASVQKVHEAGFGVMSNQWKVPAKPASKGPAPPLVASSIYIFNGLENSHGQSGVADVILQPVLQFGKSGCLLNPLKFGSWYFTSYAVGSNGRAFCGKNVGPLEEGEELLGTMTLTNVSSNTWAVESKRLKTGDTSSHSVALPNKTMDAAYLTLEAMVIYSCAAYPSSGSITFTDNSLSDSAGKAVTQPAWKKVIKHSECSQDVALPSPDSGPVTISWDPKKKKDTSTLLV